MFLVLDSLFHAVMLSGCRLCETIHTIHCQYHKHFLTTLIVSRLSVDFLFSSYICLFLRERKQFLEASQSVSWLKIELG